jgi:hypothetical protein
MEIKVLSNYLKMNKTMKTHRNKQNLHHSWRGFQDIITSFTSPTYF